MQEIQSKHNKYITRICEKMKGAIRKEEIKQGGGILGKRIEQGWWSNTSSLRR